MPGTETFTWISHQTVAAGVLLFVTFVCVLQWAAQMVRLEQARERERRDREEIACLEHRLSLLEESRMLDSLENQLLRELAAEMESDQTLDVLLLRFVPDTRYRFAVLLRQEGGDLAVHCSRGLSQHSQQSLHVETAMLAHVACERVVVRDAATLFREGGLTGLSPTDRAKARQVFLLAVGEPDPPAGVLVTTGLFPEGVSQEQQLALAERLLAGLAGSIRRALIPKRHEGRNRWTSDQIGLRAVFDRTCDSPRQMLEDFIASLVEKTGCERGALYLRTPQHETPHRLLVRAGLELPDAHRARWRQGEDRLADSTVDERQLRMFDAAALGQLGVEPPLRSALVLPIVRGPTRIGVLCLTRRDPQSVSDRERDLIAWAGEHLAGTLWRVLNQAAIERQERDDGLTDLESRRTFDCRVEKAVRHSAESGAKCSLLLLDLDHLKSLNDTWGRPACDAVLRETAVLVKEQIARIRGGAGANIARYDGEELAVLLPDICLAEALRLAETVRAAVEAAVVRFQEAELRVTVSVGVAAAPLHAASAAELIAAADVALYQAKQSGRNRVLCATGRLGHNDPESVRA